MIDLTISREPYETEWHIASNSQGNRRTPWFIVRRKDGQTVYEETNTGKPRRYTTMERAEAAAVRANAALAASRFPYEVPSTPAMREDAARRLRTLLEASDRALKDDLDMFVAQIASDLGVRLPDLPV